MWKDQVQAFGETYHAIAYSRRYNFPNTNELRPNHSAAVDAEDLADLMQELNLGKSHIVGTRIGIRRGASASCQRIGRLSDVSVGRGTCVHSCRWGLGSFARRALAATA